MKYNQFVKSAGIQVEEEANTIHVGAVHISGTKTGRKPREFQQGVFSLF